MDKPSSFKERYQLLIAEVILRYGLIGYQSYGSWSHDMDMAKHFSMPTDGGFMQPMHMDQGKCPTCSSKLKVIDPREETVMVWQGTFWDDDMQPFATGTLICAAHGDSHVRQQVWMHTTLGAAVQHIDEVANEWGW